MGCQYASNCNSLPYTGGSMILEVALVVGLVAVAVALVLIAVDVIGAMLIVRKEDE